MDQIKEAIDRLETDVAELKIQLPNWDSQSQNAQGARMYKGIARRIVWSAQRLEQLVRENTFSYP